MFPIYIPSKGRAACLKTAALLNADCLDYSVVVEPQEAEAYQDYPILVLPEDNQGLAYSRQFIKFHSKSQGEKWHWQLDDDINRFLLRFPGVPVKHVSASEALGHVEHNVLRYSNVGQAGMNQNSWPSSADIKWNNLPVQAVLNNNATASRYRSLEPFEDLDYTLQVLDEGFCTMLFDRLRTDTPKTGSNEGGLNKVYKNWSHMHRSMSAIIKAFPGLSMNYDAKGWHLKKNRIFSTFKQKPILISK